MILSTFLGENEHVYNAKVNIPTNQKDYPPLINLLLDNKISFEFKINIINNFDSKIIKDSVEWAKNNSLVQNIFQAILVNQGAWSNNFSLKDNDKQTLSIQEKAYLDNLFLYFFEIFPCNLTQETFLQSSNMLKALIVYELPKSLDKALELLTPEEKENFFNDDTMDFQTNYYSDRPIYFPVFFNNNRQIIEVMLKHDFDINRLDSINQESVSFYLNNFQLANFLIEKGLVYDLNQKNKKGIALKDFIQDKIHHIEKDYLTFFEKKKTELPFDFISFLNDIDDLYIKNNTKKLFQEKINFFISENGYSYKGVSIYDIVFSLINKNYSNNHYNFIKKFLEKNTNNFLNPKLKQFYFEYNEKSQDKYNSNSTLSDQSLYMELFKNYHNISKTDLTLKEKCQFLKDYNQFLLRNINFYNLKLDKKQTEDLIFIMMTSSSYYTKELKKTLSYNGGKTHIIDKAIEENILPIESSILKELFTENPNVHFISEQLLKLDKNNFDIYTTMNTIACSPFIDNNNDNIVKPELLALIEKYNISHSINTEQKNTTTHSKTNKRL